MNTSSKKRPRSGGKTSRVWEIADQVARESGGTVPTGEVVSRYVAEGGNEGTARTQMGKWRKASGQATPDASTVDPVWINLAPDGRVVIPADMRRAMQIDASGQARARVVDGELRVLSGQVTRMRAQDLVRAFDTGEGSPVEELLRERRADSARE